MKELFQCEYSFNSDYYALKGQIDILFKGILKDPNVPEEEEVLIPLEFKSGKSKPSYE